MQSTPQTSVYLYSWKSVNAAPDTFDSKEMKEILQELDEEIDLQTQLEREAKAKQLQINKGDKK